MWFETKTSEKGHTMHLIISNQFRIRIEHILELVSRYFSILSLRWTELWPKIRTVSLNFANVSSYLQDMIQILDALYDLQSYCPQDLNTMTMMA